MLDDEVVKSVWMPLGKDKTNELCMYVDMDDEPRFMLFSWNQENPDPETVVNKGMQGGGRVVHISGVGEQAAAGFRDEELKLFAARTGSGMVGFRARDISSEESDAFVILKELADMALTRLH
jgi:hypothetical protein